jgi:gas vesicle protein
MTSRRIPEETSSGFSGLFVLGALGLGATLMYLLDPDSGRRRRELLRDKYVNTRIALQDATEAAVQAAAQRTSRAIKRTQQLIASDVKTGESAVEREDSGTGT